MVLDGCGVLDCAGEDIACRLYPTLEQLSLRACRKLTDAGGRQIARLGNLKTKHSAPPLQWLEVGGTRLTDKSCGAIVRQSPQLQLLDLRGVKITDATMRDVMRLAELKALNVSFSNVSAACVAELRTALPSLRDLRADGLDGLQTV